MWFWILVAGVISTTVVIEVLARRVRRQGEPSATVASWFIAVRGLRNVVCGGLIAPVLVGEPTWLIVFAGGIASVAILFGLVQIGLGVRTFRHVR